MLTTSVFGSQQVQEHLGTLNAAAKDEIEGIQERIKDIKTRIDGVCDAGIALHDDLTDESSQPKKELKEIQTRLESRCALHCT